MLQDQCHKLQTSDAQLPANVVKSSGKDSLPLYLADPRVQCRLPELLGWCWCGLWSAAMSFRSYTSNLTDGPGSSDLGVLVHVLTQHPMQLNLPAHQCFLSSNCYPQPTQTLVPQVPIFPSHFPEYLEILQSYHHSLIINFVVVYKPETEIAGEEIPTFVHTSGRQQWDSQGIISSSSLAAFALPIRS